jgi:hypothetical protein
MSYKVEWVDLGPYTDNEDLELRGLSYGEALRFKFKLSQDIDLVDIRIRKEVEYGDKQV